MKRERERKGDFDFRRNERNPVYMATKRNQGMRLKQLSRSGILKKISARAEL